jgi:hypothetical protein
MASFFLTSLFINPSNSNILCFNIFFEGIGNGIIISERCKELLMLE